MGALLARMVRKVLGQLTKERRILMLGLDAAGKTTALYKLQLGEDSLVSTIPTIGFNVEHVRYKNVEFTMFDVGGQARIRPLWRHYFQNNDALIWVVDSSDTERFAEAREELRSCLADPHLGRPDVRLLVLANKQDLPNAASADDVARRLGLILVPNRWKVQPCCALHGDGLLEGLEWLANQLQ